ncbi:MAG TPA: S-adenosylmethionine decarboxylase [Gemmatimonadales bacterium]|jgi:S-adenosylmethionine/arginine decarboxylase-like enzyme
MSTLDSESSFHHDCFELSELASERLSDPDALSAMVVAAAGAVGMLALGPPVVRQGPRGLVIGMLCRDGHIVVHATPGAGTCFIDIAARAPANVAKGVDVILRRLGVPP